ncbi:uncharacterized protein CIMG_12198 [Coccidioides immitis RS]|uniref:Uncharacterized protein n=1 Tax=Coccidioides immitis (strain RS) TaxID=246410 RepID=J3K5V5_COCIM|nr:uncharacterized protein CIMG_12198 [Coccidioides immitis RS]EAS29869.3 hypothetical protein CIMG_12198 [Coccidioides immitis RS]
MDAKSELPLQPYPPTSISKLALSYSKGNSESLNRGSYAMNCDLEDQTLKSSAQGTRQNVSCGSREVYPALIVHDLYNGTSSVGSLLHPRKQNYDGIQLFVE